MNSYYTNRDLKTRNKLLNKTIDEVEKELARSYKASATRIRNIITDLYIELLESATDGTLLVSDLYKFDRYYKVLEQLNKELTRLGNKEIAIFEPQIKAYYKANSKLVGNQLGLTNKINENAVKQAIQSIWCNDGKDWSSRIWSNKTELQKKLQQGLIDSVATGKAHGKLSKEISQTFATSYSEAERIVRTELSYIQNKSAIDRFKDAGIEKYEISIEKVNACDLCREYSNKQFDINEIVLPLHPNCRCAAIPVIKEG